MQKVSIVTVCVLSSVLLSGCLGDASPLTAIPATDSRPSGINQDFIAVYESLDGQFSSTTSVIQQGTQFSLRKISSQADIRCDNLTATLSCTSGTGNLMSSEEAEKTLRVEYTTMQRLIGRHRLHSEDVPYEKQSPPSNLPLFKASDLPQAFSTFAKQLPATTLESCFKAVSEEETELFCFGGELMPYWISTASTSIGNITSARFLKAFIQTTISQEEFQRLATTL